MAAKLACADSSAPASSVSFSCMRLTTAASASAAACWRAAPSSWSLASSAAVSSRMVSSYKSRGQEQVAKHSVKNGTNAGPDNTVELLTNSTRPVGCLPYAARLSHLTTASRKKVNGKSATAEHLTFQGRVKTCSGQLYPRILLMPSTGKVCCSLDEGLQAEVASWATLKTCLIPCKAMLSS